MFGRVCDSCAGVPASCVIHAGISGFHYIAIRLYRDCTIFDFCYIGIALYMDFPIFPLPCPTWLAPLYWLGAVYGAGAVHWPRNGPAWPGELARPGDLDSKPHTWLGPYTTSEPYITPCRANWLGPYTGRAPFSLACSGEAKPGAEPGWHGEAYQERKARRTERLPRMAWRSMKKSDSASAWIRSRSSSPARRSGSASKWTMTSAGGGGS